MGSCLGGFLRPAARDSGDRGVAEAATGRGASGTLPAKSDGEATWDPRHLPTSKQVRAKVETARDHAFTGVILEEGGGPSHTGLVFKRSIVLTHRMTRNERYEPKRSTRGDPNLMTQHRETCLHSGEVRRNGIG